MLSRGIERGRSRPTTERIDQTEATMDIILGSFAFLVAALCVGVMGFAIQRGATCTVAAVDEVVGKGSFRRLVSLVEAGESCPCLPPRRQPPQCRWRPPGWQRP